jgi:hypothetical protein
MVRAELSSAAFPLEKGQALCQNFNLLEIRYLIQNQLLKTA